MWPCDAVQCYEMWWSLSSRDPSFFAMYRYERSRRDLCESESPLPNDVLLVTSAADGILKLYAYGVLYCPSWRKFMYGNNVRLWMYWKMKWNGGYNVFVMFH